MKGNSAPWLLAGILAFALGAAGGWNSKKATTEPEKTPPPATKPLGSALTTASPKRIQQPELAERIDFLEDLTTTDLDKLPDLLRGLIDADGNSSDYLALNSVIDRWIELDPEGGFAFFLENFPDAAYRSASISAFARRWARVDPDAAIAAASQTAGPHAIRSVAEELATHRPDDFFRLCSDGQHDFHVSAAAQHLSREDPQAMLAFLPQLEEIVRSAVSADLAFGWAKKDPDAAVTWARGLEAGRDKTRTFRALAFSLIERDPERAAELYLEGGNLEDQMVKPPLSDSGYRGQNFHYTEAAAQLAKSDPVAAFEWAQRFRTDGKHHYLVAGLTPPSAVGLIDYFSGLPDEAFPEGEMIYFPNPWNPTDTEEGLARLSEIPNPHARKLAAGWIRFATPISIATDPAAVSARLLELAPSQRRDRGIASLVATLRVGEPDSALQWVQQIGDDSIRKQATAGLLKEQPESWGRAALDSLDLDQDQRAEIKKLMKPYPTH